MTDHSLQYLYDLNDLTSTWTVPHLHPKRKKTLQLENFRKMNWNGNVGNRLKKSLPGII